MAKQTFTTGQVLTAAQMTSLQETAMTGGPASTKTVSYVLVAADAGTRVAMNAAGSTTITVNTALFSAGDTVSIQNIGAGVCTVTAGTATVNTSGSLVLAQYQGGILYFTSASTAIFFQFATPASGDIEGVTAGTGISGGGTSGTVTITNSMATAIDAKGDLVVGTGADAFSRLAVGTNGQVLTADSGEATGLKFATPAGGGKVLQVLTDTTQTRVANATTSFVDTGLEIAITPSSATSKILIMITADSYKTDGNANNAIIWRLFRDATRIQSTQDALYTGTALIQNGTWSCIYLDSPATTSATTYKLQFANINASATVAIVPNSNDAQGNMTLMEIGA
jgi:hypothetical protein